MPVGISLLWLYCVTTRQQWQYRLKVQFYCCLRSVMPSSIVNSMWSCCCGGIFELRGHSTKYFWPETRNFRLIQEHSIRKTKYRSYYRFNTNTSFGIDPPPLVYRGDYFGRTPNLEINWNNNNKKKTILEFALVWEFSSIIHSKCQCQVKLHCCKSVNQQLALDAEWEG